MAKPPRPTQADLKERFGLNPRQALFVLFYTGEHQGNASASYKAAGYEPSNEESARAMSSRLLTDANVSAAVEYCQQSLAERIGLTAEDVLREIRALGMSRLSDFTTWGPGGVNLRESETLPEEIRGAARGVKETKDGVQIELHHKTKALEMLAKHVGLVVDRVDITSGGEQLQTGVLLVPDPAATIDAWNAERKGKKKE